MEEENLLYEKYVQEVQLPQMITQCNPYNKIVDRADTSATTTDPLFFLIISFTTNVTQQVFSDRAKQNSGHHTLTKFSRIRIVQCNFL